MLFSRQRFEAAYRMVQMCTALNSAVPTTVDLHLFEALGSTNQTAWDLLEQGAFEGTVVVALEQTAGRGQWGRQWISPPGGLYLSVVLTPKLATQDAAQITIATAWGIARVLRTLPGQMSGVTDRIPIPVQLKWPNDLVVQERKLGGILTETRVQQGVITKAVVGIGINWTNPVPETGITLQSILEEQPTPLIESLELLAAMTVHGLLTGYHHWQQQGITAILPSYVNLLLHRDRPILIDGRSGKIVGVTPLGELQVQFESDAPDAKGSPLEIYFKPGTISLGYGDNPEVPVS
jgi:BirA family biotin operon repressor/biotin-[acetyl-CoA-carboxylase] ligase